MEFKKYAKFVSRFLYILLLREERKHSQIVFAIDAYLHMNGFQYFTHFDLDYGS